MNSKPSTNLYKVYRQYWSERLKNARSFCPSPDAREYPFVLVFRTKDIAKQREQEIKDANSDASDENHLLEGIIK